MEQNDECPKGHCAVCGLGFAEYVACEEVGCEWVPEVKRKRKPRNAALSKSERT